MKLYIPSWNGDFRLEADGKGSKLIVHDPTPHEQKIVKEFLQKANGKGWVGELDAKFGKGKSEIALSASLAKASKVLIKLTRPEKQTLTAVSFSDGKLSIIEGADDDAVEKISETVEKAAESENKEKPAVAASVKRPTPCCPDCEIGSVAPASEVLLAFLNEEEHANWARERAIVVTGGLTGHRYILAHRNSALAALNTKICFDLDDGEILKFHDNSVPPEEEILAAKLILEHREPWLRNEATLFRGDNMKFKNPFGDIMDGTETAAFVTAFGDLFKGRPHLPKVVV